MRIASLLLAGALAAGCATQQPAPDPLAQARSVYQQAADNPHVRRFAPIELANAGEALNRAERMQATGADAAPLSHQAYLAQRQAEIASHLGMARAADERLQSASAQRERILLEARASQAERARAEAEQARAAASKELQQSQAQLQQSQAAHDEELRRLQAQVAELKTRDTERGLVLALGSELLFDSGEAVLKPGGRRALDQIARVLREQPDRPIAVEGFTDAVGGDAMNQALSERRAEAVRVALIERGVDAQRVTSRGLGEAYPVASNDTAAGRQLNRRVEIVVSHQPAAAAGGTR